MKTLLETHPCLVKEWHPLNNIYPNDVSRGSHKRVWWIAECGHEFDMVIKERTLANNGCPFCSGKRVNSENCLLTQFPDISKEWHPTKNTISPQMITGHSNKKAWWLGACGHEWESSINNRTGSNKRNCPYCANQKACFSNCLLTKYPDIAKEWHPIKNKISPTDIVAKSVKKVWWIGKCNHEWQAKVIDRVNNYGCPFCSGHRVCESNCLNKLSPDIAKEWHPTKNENLIPSSVTNYSHKKVWWTCHQGHEWQSIISNRTGKTKSGCPQCNFESKGERIICDTLKLLNIDFKRQFKIKECKNKRSLPFDFAILKNNTLLKLIEYQGEQHYKLMRFTDSKIILEKTKMRDKIKFDFCSQNNIPLLVIPYWTSNLTDFVEKFVTD